MRWYVSLREVVSNGGFPTNKVYLKNLKMTHFKLMFHFYTPWKRQKNRDFLTFSGGKVIPLDESCATAYFVSMFLFILNHISLVLHSHIKTSHLIWATNLLTGFYTKCKIQIGLKKGQYLLQNPGKHWKKGGLFETHVFFIGKIFIRKWASKTLRKC